MLAVLPGVTLHPPSVVQVPLLSLEEGSLDQRWELTALAERPPEQVAQVEAKVAAEQPQAVRAQTEL